MTLGPEAGRRGACLEGLSLQTVRRALMSDFEADAVAVAREAIDYRAPTSGSRRAFVRERLRANTNDAVCSEANPRRPSETSIPSPAPQSSQILAYGPLRRLLGDVSPGQNPILDTAELPVMPSRRDLVRTGGAASLAALAGCARLPVIPGPRLSLELRNEIQREVAPTVELIRPNGHEYSEATVYDETITVPAPADRTDDPGRRSVENVAPARGYRVRVWLRDTYGTPLADYRYYPDCGWGLGRDERDETPRLFIELDRAERRGVTATVSQTRCSDDSFWY